MIISLFLKVTEKQEPSPKNEVPKNMLTMFLLEQTCLIFFPEICLQK